MYTPEMVIQGEAGFVGSDLDRARSEIQSKLKGAQEFAVSVTPKPDHHWTVSAQLPPALAAQTHRLTALLYAASPSVHVLAGENRGGIMSGDRAVRDWIEMPAPKDGRS